LEVCLNRITSFCDLLKITLDEKKTRITRLSQGVVFLNGKYALLPSGKVLRRPLKDSTKRMRTKLVKFRKFIAVRKSGFEYILSSMARQLHEAV